MAPGAGIRRSVANWCDVRGVQPRDFQDVESCGLPLGIRRSVASWRDVRGVQPRDFQDVESCGLPLLLVLLITAGTIRAGTAGPLPTAEKRRAEDVTPVVHVSVLAVIATLLRHKTFFLRVLPCHRGLLTPSVVLPLTNHDPGRPDLV